MEQPLQTAFALPAFFPSPLESDVVFYYRNNLQGARATLRRIPAIVTAIDPKNAYGAGHGGCLQSGGSLDARDSGP